MNYLIALDKFKDSFTAKEGCEIVKKALLDIIPGARVDLLPLTDGGEGFAEILTEQLSGKLHYAEVPNALGKSILAHWGTVSVKNIPNVLQSTLKLTNKKGTVAIVEMAQSSGLEAIDPQSRNPWHTTTYGTGEILKKVALSNPRAIIIGLGGSATNDLGFGALQSLGAIKAYDDQGKLMGACPPKDWSKIAHLSTCPIQSFPPIWIGCDVNNPLLGTSGCTYHYGKQKGLTKETAEQMEQLLSDQAHKLCSLSGKSFALTKIPGSGAAGGIGFGLSLLVGGAFISGINLVNQWVSFTSKLDRADCIITGEGSFDATSLNGKVLGSILEQIKGTSKRIHIFAGNIESKVIPSLPPNVYTHKIAPDHISLEESIKSGKMYLYDVSRKLFESQS